MSQIIHYKYIEETKRTKSTFLTCNVPFSFRENYKIQLHLTIMLSTIMIPLITLLIYRVEIKRR